MKVFLALARLRLADLLRRPTSIFFLLGLPVLLMSVLGVVFWRGHPFEEHRVSLVGSEAAFARARGALGELPGVRVERERSGAVALGRLRSRMIAAVVESEDPSTWRVRVAPQDQLFGRGLAGALPGRAELALVASPRWGYLHYLFPGLLVMSLLTAGLYGMGHTMVRYRRTQLLKKLALTPLSRATFVAAQVASRLVLVLGQALVMVGAAWLLFDLPLGPAQLAWLALLSAVGILVFLGVGFLVACLFRSEDTVSDAIGAVTMPLILLSEMFFPLAHLPAPLAHAAGLLPSTILVRLVREVVLHGETQLGVLGPGLAGLGLWALLAYATSVLVFRWTD